MNTGRDPKVKKNMPDEKGDLYICLYLFIFVFIFVYICLFQIYSKMFTGDKFSKHTLPDEKYYCILGSVNKVGAWEA